MEMQIIDYLPKEMDEELKQKVQVQFIKGGNNKVINSEIWMTAKTIDNCFGRKNWCWSTARNHQLETQWVGTVTGKKYCKSHKRKTFRTKLYRFTDLYSKLK